MKISIIIPVLNETEQLPAALAAVTHQQGDYEMIVCDGGSTDESQAIAQQAGAKVITGPSGRGQQLAAGAQCATGDIFLFLHADTVLAPGTLNALRTTLRNPAINGGNFRVIFDGPTRFATWLTGFYAFLRSKGLYYVDSAIFVRKKVYEAIGGIKPIALMEDYDLVSRLEASGQTICIDTPPVTTSSRRFDGRKPWCIFTQWVVLHALYYLRVRTRFLANLYRSSAHSPANET